LDFGWWLGYIETLAMLYAWTLLAAGAFFVAETVIRGRRPPGPKSGERRPAS
jgi:hypothetical protein